MAFLTTSMANFTRSMMMSMSPRMGIALPAPFRSPENGLSLLMPSMTGFSLSNVLKKASPGFMATFSPSATLPTNFKTGESALETASPTGASFFASDARGEPSANSFSNLRASFRFPNAFFRPSVTLTTMAESFENSPAPFENFCANRRNPKLSSTVPSLSKASITSLTLDAAKPSKKLYAPTPDRSGALPPPAPAPEPLPLELSDWGEMLFISSKPISCFFHSLAAADAF